MQDLIRHAKKLFDSGQLNEAEARFQDALAIDATCAEALNGLGIIAYTRGSFDRSLTYFNKALASEPGLTSAQINKVHVYLRQKKWSDVGDTLRQMLATDCDNVDVIEFAVERYIDLRDYDAARDLLSNAVISFPGDKRISALYNQLNKSRNQRELASQWPSLAKDMQDKAIEIAGGYKQVSLQSNFAEDYSALHIASLLGNLQDPANAANLPLEQARAPRSSLLHGPKEAADLKGRSILFAPMIIAGVVPELAKRLKNYGAKVETIDFTPNYLGYQADYTLHANTAREVIDFANYSLELANKFDIICLEFASSFKYHPNTGLNSVFNVPANGQQPYADLLPLKEKGKKLFFTFWGSDCYSQSMLHYFFLKYLGFDELPPPPYQTKHQYRNIKAIEQLADAIIAPAYFNIVLPKTIPFWNAGIDLDLWKYKKTSSSKISKILTAPTSLRKKNYELIQACLNSLRITHPNVNSFCVQNTPHHEVPALYARADLGVEQATIGFGVLALEMMALGLPVVTSFHYARQLASNEEAPLLSFNNVRELYARIAECIENPQRAAQLGKLGREYVEEYHDINQHAKAFSHYVDQALSDDGRVWHIESNTYAESSAIWQKNPETVLAFKYFDISVPLFCAIGSFERAIIDCQEAIGNEYRGEKFSAWLAAIYTFLDINQELCNAYLQRLKASNSKSQLELISYYTNSINNGKALMDEAAKMFVEARQIKASPT